MEIENESEALVIMDYVKKQENFKAKIAAEEVEQLL